MLFKLLKHYLWSITVYRISNIRPALYLYSVYFIKHFLYFQKTSKARCLLITDFRMAQPEYKKAFKLTLRFKVNYNLKKCRFQTIYWNRFRSSQFPKYYRPIKNTVYFKPYQLLFILWPIATIAYLWRPAGAAHDCFYSPLILLFIVFV